MEALQDDEEPEEDLMMPIIAYFHYTGQPKEKIPFTMTHVTVDPSVHEIEMAIFQSGKYSLLSANIPGTVETVGEASFYGCESLVEVQFHRGLKEICDTAFRGCYSLATMELPQGLLHIGRSAFHHCRALVSVSVPPTVEKLENDAFACCSSLEEVHLRQGLKIIGDRSFLRCSSLREVKPPEGLVEIGNYAFQSCESLGSMHFSRMQLSEGLGSIHDGAFKSCKSLVEMHFPQGLVSVSHDTFSCCGSLRTVSIPESVETIGRNAFSSCCSLANIKLSEGLKVIRRGAFQYCESLSAISLPLSLEEIECSAFANCTSLLGIEIPSGSKMFITCTSFRFCSSLVNVSIPSSTEVDDATFSGYLLDDCDGNTSWLCDRYANLPVHEACYYSSGLTRDSIIRVLDSHNALAVFEDLYDMTPFHVLATSANLKVDTLECLLDFYPLDILYRQDVQYRTMFDYLLANTCDAAFPLVKMVLQKAIVDRISRWVLGKKWSSMLLQRIQSVEMSIDDDIKIRYRIVDDFLSDVGHYTRKEMASLMELALWKLRMRLVPKEDRESDGSYRESCRYQSGAEVVTANVVGYLWMEAAKSITALSVFPLCLDSFPDRM